MIKKTTSLQRQKYAVLTPLLIILQHFIPSALVSNLPTSGLVLAITKFITSPGAVREGGLWALAYKLNCIFASHTLSLFFVSISVLFEKVTKVFRRN